MNLALDRILSLKVSDVMTRGVVPVAAHQPLGDVAQTFIRHDVSAAPVIDDDGRCVGMLSATDFVRGLVRGDWNARGLEGLKGAPASKHMSAAVQSTSPDASLVQAARMMCSLHVHRLPVIDGDGRLVGVISTMDVVAATVNASDEMRQELAQATRRGGRG